MRRQNPFPGMNPWMQTVWNDVHTRLIGYVADALGAELPDDLLARAEENVTLSDASGNTSSHRPDVAVIEPESWSAGASPVWTPDDDPQLAQRVASPVLVQTDTLTPRWIEIRSAGGALITVIEITSPANKTSSGRYALDLKLQKHLAGEVNVMEIDLIRGGLGYPDTHPGNWPATEGVVIAVRPHCSDVTELYPCPLREPLPAVRVPLRRHEKDAALDLQPLINRCYANGRYWMLDYAAELSPPLNPEDADWSDAILREAGLRQ